MANDTPLTISNRALQKLGAAPIVSLDTTVDTSERAQTMCTLYEPTLKAALQSARWKFAQVQKVLTGWDCTPVYGYSCAYVVPGELLQIEETNIDQDEPWEQQTYVCGPDGFTCYTNVIVTDSCSPIAITYTAYVTDPARWSSLFREALVMELAYQSSFSITASQARVEGISRDRDVAWKVAKARDAQQQKRLRRWLSDSLLRARFGRGGLWPTRDQDI